jgi:hypothetical protein
MVNVLGPEQLRHVIAEPARLTDTILDDGLEAQIVRDAGRGDALPLLSYLLTELYELAKDDHHISWAEYRDAGGVGGVINRRAEAAVREVSGQPLGHILDTLLLFVTLEGAEPTRQTCAPTVAWLNTGVLVPPNVSAFISESLQYRVSERDRRADIAARKALETFSHDPETAIVLSLEACTALSPTVLARFALYRSLATGLRHVLHQPGPVSSVAFAADGHLAVGTGSGAVRIYSTDADLLRDLTDLPGPVNSVAFGADGRLAVGTGRSSDVGSVQIYTSGGQLIHDLIDLPGPVRSVAFAPDGRLAVGTGSGAARIYSADADLLRDLTDLPDSVNSVAFAPDGRLAVGGFLRRRAPRYRVRPIRRRRPPRHRHRLRLRLDADLLRRRATAAQLDRPARPGECCGLRRRRPPRRRRRRPQRFPPWFGPDLRRRRESAARPDRPARVGELGGLRRPGTPDRRLAVLVAPGNAGNRLARAPLAAALAERGTTVVLVDYRGYGGNAGSPSEEGLAPFASEGTLNQVIEFEKIFFESNSDGRRQHRRRSLCGSHLPVPQSRIIDGKLSEGGA